MMYRICMRANSFVQCIFSDVGKNQFLITNSVLILSVQPNSTDFAQENGGVSGGSIESFLRYCYSSLGCNLTKSKPRFTKFLID